MAIGDILRAGSTLFDSGSGASELNFLGSLANYGQSYLDEAEADARKKAALRNAQVANAYQMEQAQRNNAMNDAIRNEILQKSANLQEALKQAYSYLGMPYQPTAQEINQDFVDIYSQNSKDLDKLAAMAMSKGYASNLAKGMGDSTLQKDHASNLAAKLADKYSAMQQKSYDQAIARADARAKTLNSGRDTLLSEINTVYGGENIDNLKGVYSSTFQNPGTSTDYATLMSGQQSGLEKQNNDDLATLIDSGKNLFGLDKQQEEEIAAINPLEYAP